MHYGVDYYPEHELELRWETDARLMVEAGFTTVRLAEFAWTRLEPREGQFAFGWLDRAIECLSKYGLQIVLGTPTAAPPHWLIAAHPDMLFVDAEGRTMAPQSRRFACTANPTYRAVSERIVSAMAQRYGAHPNVIGWQIDNEFGCHSTVRCYCATCRATFRAWVKRRYKTLDALNAAWGTVFWSQEYDDWAQVAPPLPTPTYHNPSHILDFYRFSSEQVCDYLRLQAAILRDHAPHQFVCHNLMANFDQLDHAPLTEALDLVTWDNYISEGTRWDDVARFHEMIRSLRHRPFWVMESPPGQVNWTRYNPDLRPNEARLRSLQAVAHGADGVFYFHWRAFRNGAEQYHSAILPHDGIPGRAYREASALGAELSQLHSLLDGTTVRAEVAIIEDMASYWALQHQPHNAALADPRRYVRPWYNALRRRNVAVEFCQPDEDLSDYRLVIAPALHVVTPAVAGNLRRYVENGGLLIIGPRSGFKEPSNRVTDLPLPGLLGDLAGVRVAEWAALPPGQTRSLCGSDGVLTGTRASVELWRELLELRGATAAAWYLGGAEDGQVAAARHRLGAGEVYYIGAMSDTLSDTLVDAVLRQRGIDGAAATPEGVEACVREGATGRFLFLLNHTDREQTVALEQHWSALDGGTPLDEVRIAPLDVRVFKELGVRG